MTCAKDDALQERFITPYPTRRHSITVKKDFKNSFWSNPGHSWTRLDCVRL